MQLAATLLTVAYTVQNTNVIAKQQQQQQQPIET